MVRILKRADFQYLTGKARMYCQVTIISFVLGLMCFIVLQVSGIIIGGILFAISLYSSRNWMNYKKGIGGEKTVSKKLQKLSDEFILLDDVQLYPNSGNIDHIVLGPNGVFIIETKNYSGVVSCYGDTWYHSSGRGNDWKIQSISEQAKNNARNLYNFLKRNTPTVFMRGIFVEPIIVFSNSSMTLKTRNPTVTITTPRKLVQVIQRFRSDSIFSDKTLSKIGLTILSNSANETV